MYVVVVPESKRVGVLGAQKGVNKPREVCYVSLLL